MSGYITREVTQSEVSIRHGKYGVMIRPLRDLDAEYAKEVAYAILRTFMGPVKCVYWDLRGLGMSVADKSVHHHMCLSAACFSARSEMVFIIGKHESSFHARVLKSIFESRGRECRIIRHASQEEKRSKESGTPITKV